MNKLQEVRLERAKEQDLRCFRLRFVDDAARFSVMGLSDIYEVEISQDAELWPPTCTCADNAWRPELLCKHIALVLHRMGASDEQLSDCCWEPSQSDIYELLFSAPEAVDSESHSSEGSSGDIGSLGHSAPTILSEFR